jgi:circadian clock protein KaiB
MPPRKRQKRRPRPRKPVYDTEEFERLLRDSSGREKYVLKLYITGTTPRSSAAIGNIRSLCEDYLSGRYQLEVVDIYQQPALAAGEQIIAAPTLVKELPPPVRRMVGDLASRHRILIGLNIQEIGDAGKSAKTNWAKP